MGKLKITYKKSMLSCPEKHRVVIRSLGFRKLNQTRVYNDTPQIRGIIQKVGYLLHVEEEK